MSKRPDVRLTSALLSPFSAPLGLFLVHLHPLHAVSKLVLINDLSSNLVRLPRQPHQRLKLIELSHLLPPLQGQAGLSLPLFLLSRLIYTHEIAFFEVFPLLQLAIQRQIASAPHVDRARPVRDLVAEFLRCRKRSEATLINALDAILSRSCSRRCSSFAASRSE